MASLKKFLPLILTASPLMLLLQFLPITARATTTIDDMQKYAKGTVDGLAINSQQSFAAMAGSIFGGLAATIGLLFVFFLVYAGYLWFFAPLKEENIEKAKNIIKWAIWGMVFILISYFIVTFLLGAFK
jgi:hypothetical protein